MPYRVLVCPIFRYGVDLQMLNCNNRNHALPREVLFGMIWFVLSNLRFGLMSQSTFFSRAQLGWKHCFLGPVVESIVSLTISLRHKFVKQISAKVTNTQLFFVEKM